MSSVMQEMFSRELQFLYGAHQRGTWQTAANLDTSTSHIMSGIGGVCTRGG